MKTLPLLEVPKDHPTIRQLRREEVSRLKKEHGIFTHNSPGNGDWLALCLPECVSVLDGYNLTDEEKTSAFALMAGYCRLLDEAGLIEEGHKTEYAAVTSLVGRITRKGTG